MRNLINHLIGSLLTGLFFRCHYITVQWLTAAPKSIFSKKSDHGRTSTANVKSKKNEIHFRQKKIRLTLQRHNFWVLNESQKGMEWFIFSFLFRLRLWLRKLACALLKMLNGKAKSSRVETYSFVMMIWPHPLTWLDHTHTINQFQFYLFMVLCNFHSIFVPNIIKVHTLYRCANSKTVTGPQCTNWSTRKKEAHKWRTRFSTHRKKRNHLLFPFTSIGLYRTSFSSK